MPQFDSEEERDQADAVLVQQYETALALSKDRLVAKIQEILDGEDNDDDEYPLQDLTLNRAVYETRDDHLRVWWKVEAGRGDGTWWPIEDGDDAEAIAKSVMENWDGDWDDEDGLAIGSGDVVRGDDGYGEILTIEQLRRQTDYS